MTLPLESDCRPLSSWCCLVCWFLSILIIGMASSWPNTSNPFSLRTDDKMLFYLLMWAFWSPSQMESSLADLFGTPCVGSAESSTFRCCYQRCSDSSVGIGVFLEDNTGAASRKTFVTLDSVGPLNTATYTAKVVKERLKGMRRILLRVSLGRMKGGEKIWRSLQKRSTFFVISCHKKPFVLNEKNTLKS